MTDLWMPRLSEYLDGDLPDDQRLALERHVEGCPGCATALDELRRVVAGARSLEDREPATDLWSGIARRITAAPGADVVDMAERRRGAGRFLVSLPQLAAAAVVLMALTGGTTWLVLAGLRGPTTVGRTDAPVSSRNVLSSASARGYDAAVADLERTLERERGQLDTATVRVIEHNLRVIDQAIAQARQALATDPSSVYLNGHLADAMRRKLELLRRATAIAGVAS